MAPRRLHALARAIHLEVDGERVPARQGEPVAMALAAAGRVVLSRSVKYHRPRGAACYAGRCEGCSMRVDGMPSVRTCRLPATDGMVLETQNVVGSARRDLLGLTDWFFPEGMNHHEMFTWNDQVNQLMQKVARRVAGIGRLPTVAREGREPQREAVEVLVIGAGPAGLEAATRIAASGRQVVLLDEEPLAGGSLRFRVDAVEGTTGPMLAERLAAKATAAKAELALETAALAVFAAEEDVPGWPAEERERRVVLAMGPEGLHLFEPATLVIAMGRHEGASAFEGNERPGVITAGAAWRLLANEMRPGERVVLAGEGLEPLAEALRAAGAKVLGPYPEASLRRARGRTSVSSVELEVEGEKVGHRCDALVVAAPTSAVFELAMQAGVEARFSGEGFELDVGEAGETAAAAVHVVGSAAGRHSLEAARAQARRMAEALTAGRRR